MPGMRKGDAKKQAILTAAERLFCQKGYHAASVQDILDALHTSKGSFYHHFESKESVLTTLCDNHAESSAAWTEAQLTGIADPMKRLNLVMFGMEPLRRGEAGFLSVVLPLMFTQEGRMVSTAWQDSLTAAYLPLMQRELENAADAGKIYPPKGGELADLLLMLVNRCWSHAAELMLDTIRDARQPDIPALLDELTLYRAAAERILNAPYGSVEIVRLDEWIEAEQMLERRVILPANL